MSFAPPVSRGKQLWDIFLGLVLFAVITFVVLTAVIKVPWEWLVPAMFPGAVQQGLVAPELSWDTTLLLAAALAGMAMVLRQVRLGAPGTPGASWAIDAKLNAIAKHVGIDPEAVIRAELLELVKKGNKIQAIAFYREYSGASLADAKAHVEGLERAA